MMPQPEPTPFIDVSQNRTLKPLQVFTGPAQLPSGGAFRACLDAYTDTGACQLPHMVWSGRSSNKVPVALDHATQLTDPGAQQAAALRVYGETRAAVVAMLAKLNATWNADSLDVSVFSAEGDLLHQYFDCAMMGAMDSMRPWPSPPGTSQPLWSRHTDGSEGRDFELPCEGDQLKDRTGVRDDQPPFTCGSHSRRAAIKYFLRSLPASNVHSAVTNAVQWLIGNLSAAWDNPNSYMCACLDPSGQPNGTRGFRCCQLDCAMTGPCPCPNSLPDSFACCSCDTASLLPQDLMVPFTTIQGTTLSSTLLDQAASYIKTTLWTSNDPWLKWDPGADYGWEGAQAALAQDWAAFDTTRPVQSYQELGVPFGTTIWAMCHGLLQQVCVHFAILGH